MDALQESFAFLVEKEKKNQTPPPLIKKNTFTPPTLENGLSKGMCRDHGMLWLRMMMKQAKSVPENYLSQQMYEISFKRTEYDQVCVIRDALVAHMV